MGLPGDSDDTQARYIEAVVHGAEGAFRIGNIYLPNGNPPDSEKYLYKLRWMDRLRAHAHRLLTHEEPLVLAGDYNVIPAPRDAKVPENWTSDALFLPQTRARFREILNLGLTDALRQSLGDVAWNLHLLGLSGRCLAEEQRHSDRSPAVVAAGCGSSDGSARRQTCPGLGSAVGPRARHCDVQMKRPVALRQRARTLLEACACYLPTGLMPKAAKLASNGL